MSRRPPTRSRVWLLLFALRHLIGVGIFVWLTVTFYRMGVGNSWMVVAFFGTIYAIFAVAAGRRLLALYRKHGQGAGRWK